jgi:hypothetical protein
MAKKSQIISPNLKTLMFPILSLVILLILLGVTFKEGYSQITAKQKQINDLQAQNEILENKLEILRIIEKDILESSNLTLLSLPEDNSAIFYKLTEIKYDTEINNIYIAEYETRSGTLKDGITTYFIKMGLDSLFRDPKDIINFLISLEERVTLQYIKKIVYDPDAQGGQDIITLELEVFSSELPTVVPDILEPIKNLSADQEQTLEEVKLKKVLEFVDIQPSPDSERIDPFN